MNETWIEIVKKLGAREFISFLSHLKDLILEIYIVCKVHVFFIVYPLYMIMAYALGPSIH